MPCSPATTIQQLHCGNLNFFESIIFKEFLFLDVEISILDPILSRDDKVVIIYINQWHSHRAFIIIEQFPTKPNYF